MEKLVKIMSPCVKRMELELTCPVCSTVLRQPTLLPCSHVVCRNCIIAKDEYNCECPACITTFVSGGLKPCTSLERMIDIFKSLDTSVQNLCPQRVAGMKVPSIVSPLSGEGNNRGNLEDGEFDIYGMMMDKPPMKRSLADIICEQTCNGLPNNLQSDPPVTGVVSLVTKSTPNDSGGSGENNGGGSGEQAIFGSKSSSHNAGNDSCINIEEPSIPSSLHELENPEETNKDQSSGHGTERLFMERLPLKKSGAGISVKTQAAWFPSTDPLTGEAHYSIVSYDAKSPIPTSPSETDDNDLREVKKQNLDTKHGSDCYNKPPCTSDHAYSGAAKCAFCHLSEITEFTGPMLHYANGKPVRPEEVKQSNVKHFHEKCFEWAPQAFFEGEIAKNLEGELARASQIKCSKCGQKGAALGCYVESCLKSYHVPCAVELTECRWDCVNFNLLCPFHSSCKFRYEIVELKWMLKAKRSSLLRDKSNTRKMTKTKWSSAQIRPELVTSIPDEQYNDLRAAEPRVCSEWVLCGSDLSSSDMVHLKNFASITGAYVTGMWKSNVTHVIASTNEHGACSRSRKVLMAILNGKWVVTPEWVKASMLAKTPVSEEAYEISIDCYGFSNGPKKGRLRVRQKAPKIFSGLSLYFCNQFEPPYRSFLEEVALAAGGAVLNNVETVMEGVKAQVFSLGSSFIVYNEDPPPACNPVDPEEVVRKRCDEVGDLEAKTGFKVVGHMRFLDCVAACSSAADLAKAAVQTD